MAVIDLRLFIVLYSIVLQTNGVWQRMALNQGESKSWNSKTALPIIPLFTTQGSNTKTEEIKDQISSEAEEINPAVNNDLTSQDTLENQAVKRTNGGWQHMALNQGKSKTWNSKTALPLIQSSTTQGSNTKAEEVKDQISSEAEDINPVKRTNVGWQHMALNQGKSKTWNSKTALPLIQSSTTQGSNTKAEEVKDQISSEEEEINPAVKNDLPSQDTSENQAVKRTNGGWQHMALNQGKSKTWNSKTALPIIPLSTTQGSNTKAEEVKDQTSSQDINPAENNENQTQGKKESSKEAGKKNIHDIITNKGTQSLSNVRRVPAKRIIPITVHRNHTKKLVQTPVQRIPTERIVINPRTLCDNQHYIDGIGYSAFPGHCDKYLQCFKVDGHITVVERECMAGNFWHQESALCRLPKDVPCYSDPCLTIDLKVYKGAGGCRSFYKCNGNDGISIPMCCKKGYRFDRIRCIPDVNCTDECFTPAQLDIIRSQDLACKYFPVADTPTAYITLEHDGLRPRICPKGTFFSSPNCACRWKRKESTVNRGRTRRPKCNHAFYMDFSNGFDELSGSKLTFSVNTLGTKLLDGTAHFDGKGNITLAGYSQKKKESSGPIFEKFQLGNTFAVRFHFKPDQTITSGVLFSNCGLSGPATVQIELSKNYLYAFAKGTKKETLANKIIPNAWNDVVFYFDGRTLVLSTNGRKRKSFMTGPIERAHLNNRFTIGRCHLPGTGFTGQLDNIEIFQNCVPVRVLSRRRRIQLV